MKKIIFYAILVFTAFTFFGCFTMLANASSNSGSSSSSSNGSTKVERVPSTTVTDLSGYWNDTDVRIVSEDLVAKCLASPWYTEFSRANAGRKPLVIVGTFRNQSDEHIDTTIISKKIETALVNSRKVSAVANSTTRGEIREERDDQQKNSSAETAKILKNETAADFMLQGSVKTLVDSLDNVLTRTYYVDAELVNIETNEKVWVDENSSIKKKITNQKTRF